MICENDLIGYKLSAGLFGEEMKSRKEDEAFSLLVSTAVRLREDAAKDTES